MKPIAWYDPTNGAVSTEKDSPLFTPLGQLLPLYPQRTWVGLTDEDFLEACQIAERGNYLVAFQRIQTKLKEKNSDHRN
jgi:hypothetical protein